MKNMDDKLFAKDIEMKPTFATWLQTLEADFLHPGIQF